MVKNLGFFFSILGILTVFLLSIIYNNFFYKMKGNLRLNFNKVYYFLSKIFFNAIMINQVYNSIFLFMFQLSYKFTKILDKGFFELIGPFGFYKNFKTISFFSRIFSSNIISHNIYFIIVFFIKIFKVYSFLCKLLIL